MSSFTPINARQVEEKKRAQARQCYWCVVKESLEEPCTHRDNPDEHSCCDDYEIKRSEEEEAAVKAETEATAEVETEDTVGAEMEDAVEVDTEATAEAEMEDTVGAEHKAPAQAAAERPIVEERARGKANNMKTCSRCNGKEYNMSNFADHNKVHVLEENGVQARYPCKCCKAGNCVVAQRPTSIQTYSCLSCLRSHRKCSFNGLKATPRERCRPGLHPALLRQIA